MADRIDSNHPLFQAFWSGVHRAISQRLGLSDQDDVEVYLANLMVEFLRMDRIHSLKDRSGAALWTVGEMLEAGDVRLGADSFDREREVHRHIGDFILFWTGVYPDYLKQLKLRNGRDLICDYRRQAQESYYLVSTFDNQEYVPSPPTFRKLSENFEQYAMGLQLAKAGLPDSIRFN